MQHPCSTHAAPRCSTHADAEYMCDCRALRYPTMQRLPQWLAYRDIWSWLVLSLTSLTAKSRTYHWPIFLTGKPSNSCICFLSSTCSSGCPHNRNYLLKEGQGLFLHVICASSLLLQQAHVALPQVPLHDMFHSRSYTKSLHIFGCVNFSVW